MEYKLDITRECAGTCGRSLVTRECWAELPEMIKLEIAKNFTQESRVHYACATCYLAGRVDEPVRRIRRRGDFAEDYLIYRRRSNDDAYIAKLMGLKLSSLKRMLERAKKRGEL